MYWFKLNDSKFTIFKKSSINKIKYKKYIFIIIYYYNFCIAAVVVFTILFIVQQYYCYYIDIYLCIDFNFMIQSVQY